MSDYKKILTHYGFQAQAVKTVEELAELQVAITKLLNQQHQSLPEAILIENVLSEMVDVRIMMRQLVTHFKDVTNERVMQHRQANKLCQVLNRIEKDEKKL